MPSLCWFYGISPQEFDDLTVGQVNDLQHWMNDYFKAQEKALKR